MTCHSFFDFIAHIVNSWQARNTHCSDHWSAPLFVFLLPADNSCMRMRNKIKTNRNMSSINLLIALFVLKSLLNVFI